MNKLQILSVISNLAISQGFYGLLLRFLNDGSEDAKDFMDELVSQKFKSMLDLVLYLES